MDCHPCQEHQVPHQERQEHQECRQCQERKPLELPEQGPVVREHLAPHLIPTHHGAQRHNREPVQEQQTRGEVQALTVGVELHRKTPGEVRLKIRFQLAQTLNGAGRQQGSRVHRRNQLVTGASPLQIAGAAHQVVRVIGVNQPVLQPEAGISQLLMLINQHGVRAQIGRNRKRLK